MSLWLSIRRRDPLTGASVLVELLPGFQLMGGEVARQELWGTEIMWTLGLELLPSLGDGDYLVLNTPEKISQLEHEAELIRNNIDKVLGALGSDVGYSLQRTYLRNLFNAIVLARLIGGEITIG